MKYLYLLLLIPGMAYAMTAEQSQKLNVCVWTADQAGIVQRIRHEGDSLPMFRSRAPEQLKQENVPKPYINKVMSIGEDVYESIPLEMSTTYVWAIYYTDCINTYDDMAAEAQGGWF